MTRAIPTPCQHRGCGMLVRGSGYCAEHRGLRQRAVPLRERPRGSSAERGYGAAWRRLRGLILAREPLCRSCGRPAQEVDHIVPRALGGSDRRENLQALCSSCHSAKTLRDRDGKRASEIIVVTGAPGAGKTTYCRDAMVEGDALWDWDAILAAICPAGVGARDMRPALRVLRAAAIAAPWPSRVYLVITDPEQALELAGENHARLVIVAPGIDRAMERAEARARARGSDPIEARRLVSGWAAQAQALGARLRQCGETAGLAAPNDLPEGEGGLLPCRGPSLTDSAPRLSRAPEICPRPTVVGGR